MAVIGHAWDGAAGEDKNEEKNEEEDEEEVTLDRDKW